MLTITNTEVAGFTAAMRGMRNPMNSWERADSVMDISDGIDKGFYMGPNDMSLAVRLAKGGPVHAKYRRMIVVYLDILAPLYWWKEFDTYKVGTVANSCSTMHKIHAKEFTLDDFSCEHLGYFDPEKKENQDWVDTAFKGYDDYVYPIDILVDVIAALNHNRQKFIETGDKKYWWQMIQMLPSSYEQLRTVELNYEVLRNIYISRKDHKLDEWHVFCNWIKTLPYAKELITYEGD